ncbi:TPA: hypothetical protein ACH2I9_004181 [Enterobacter asburiae]
MKTSKVKITSLSDRTKNIIFGLSFLLLPFQTVYAEQKEYQNEQQEGGNSDPKSSYTPSVIDISTLSDEQKKILESLPPETLKQMEEAYTAVQQASNSTSSEKMLQDGKLNFENAIPDIPQSLPYVNDLEAMKREQREILQLKQKIDTERLRAELLRVQGVAGTEDSSPYAINLTGINKDLKAKVFIPVWGELKVQKGDILPNGHKVLDITNDAVILTKGEESLQLPFYARPK